MNKQVKFDNRILRALVRKDGLSFRDQCVMEGYNAGGKEFRNHILLSSLLLTLCVSIVIFSAIKGDGGLMIMGSLFAVAFLYLLKRGWESKRHYDAMWERYDQSISGFYQVFNITTSFTGDVPFWVETHLLCKARDITDLEDRIKTSHCEDLLPRCARLRDDLKVAYDLADEYLGRTLFEGKGYAEMFRLAERRGPKKAK